MKLSRNPFSLKVLEAFFFAFVMGLFGSNFCIIFRMGELIIQSLQQ